MAPRIVMYDTSDETEDHEQEDVSTARFGITKVWADKLYSEAGRASVAIDNKLEVNPSVEVTQALRSEIDSAASKLKLPYTLSEFQYAAVAAEAKGHNVIVSQPTGAGKLTVPYLILQRRMSQLMDENLVMLGCMPLTSIMVEKCKNPLLRTGY